jgi:peptide/nickel transport system ATP-binding protein
VSAGDPLLSVSDLSVHFDAPGGRVQAVDGVSFEVDRDESLCLVGESGSGKTVSCEAITGLIDSDRADVEGTVEFDGTDLTELSGRGLREFRGSRIGHVFQNPQGALDPVYTVGRQVTEAVRNGSDRSKTEARARAIELLDMVGLPDPAARAEDYPHELSGGMKQRVTIAVALAGDPDLLIADEPTTALDVTIEASIVNLLNRLQSELGMALLYVTHDLGIVAELADRVTVLYAGKVMETGDVFEVFERPAHPYTQALLRCLPGSGGTTDPIEGTPPDPRDPPDGCRFHPRCPHAVEECAAGDQPPLHAVEDGGNRASCVYHGPYRESRTLRDAWRDGGGVGGGGGTGEDEGAPARDDD